MREEAWTVEASVIIPCLNSVRTLGLQLEALAAQADAPPFEVIIADNGSSDGLVAYLDRWHDRLLLRYVDAGGLPGAGYARNVGMSVASADKFLFCDSDDVVARDWVARGCEALEVLEVFSGPGFRVADEQIGEDLDLVWQRLDAALPPDKSVHERALVPWPILLGGNSGLRRSTAWAVRGYDASLPGDVEDNDLAIRLQQSGFAIGAAPSARIVYRARAGASAVFRAARARAAAQVELCERHGLWDRSPLLRGGRWRWEPARVVASGLRMLLRPAARDWEGLASRSGIALGTYQGWVRSHMRRRIPPQAVGVGFGADPDWLHNPILILSPHLDDALFSAAEIVRRARPDVWTVFAGEPDRPVTTAWDRSCGFADSEEALAVRKKEDAAAFAKTSSVVRYLPCVDGAYTTAERRARDLAFLIREVAAWVGEHSDSSPVIVLPAGAGVPVGSRRLSEEDTATAGTSAIQRASGSKLAPLIHVARQIKHRLYLLRRRRAATRGLVVNDDHRAIRDSIGDAFAGDDRVTLALMEDLPYLWWYAGDDAAGAAATRWGRTAGLAALVVDRAWKHDRVRHYASQLDVMDARHRRLGDADTLPALERVWVLPPR